MKILGIAIVMVALLASCGDKGKKSVTSSESGAENAAYFYQDSIANHLKFYKDVTADLEVEIRKYQETEMKLNKEGQTLQNNFERQKAAGMLSAIQIDQKQREIMKIGEQLQILQQTDGATLERKNAEFSKELLGKMETYGKEFCDKNGYTMLLSRQMGGQIIYMPDSKNVTMDFIKYMNEQDKK